MPRLAFAAEAVPFEGLAAANFAGYRRQVWIYFFSDFASNVLLFYTE